MPSPDGFYLTTNRFFRWLGRIKPALIPWDEIKVVDEHMRVNMRDAVGLSIGDPSLGSLALLRKEFAELEPYIKESSRSSFDL